MIFSELSLDYLITYNMIKIIFDRSKVNKFKQTLEFLLVGSFYERQTFELISHDQLIIIFLIMLAITLISVKINQIVDLLSVT